MTARVKQEEIITMIAHALKKVKRQGNTEKIKLENTVFKNSKFP